MKNFLACKVFYPIKAEGRRQKAVMLKIIFIKRVKGSFTLP
jgi:hypothetical protein